MAEEVDSRSSGAGGDGDEPVEMPVVLPMPERLKEHAVGADDVRVDAQEGADEVRDAGDVGKTQRSAAQWQQNQEQCTPAGRTPECVGCRRRGQMSPAAAQRKPR